MNVRVVVAVVLAFLLIGCIDWATRAVGATNTLGELLTDAQPIVHAGCTEPMVALAREPESEARTSAAKALAEKCDAAELSYSIARQTHLELRAALLAAQSPAGFQVGRLLELIEEATGAAARMVKAMEKLR